jgi:hypothetical protein
MISNLLDRQREISESSNIKADPFLLLKEVNEMSKIYKELSSNDEEMARANYDAFTKQTYEKVKTENGGKLANGFDPASLEEKMKKFKFAKPSEAVDMNKDSNWFAKIGQLKSGKSSDKETA